MSERQLFMRLPQLTDLPSVPPLPTGYSLLTADVDRMADRKELAAVLSDAFEEHWDAERVERVLSQAEGVRTIYAVVRDGEIVATASARTLPQAYPAAGYVHYVGVDSRHRGHRLGEIVTHAVLRDFVASGETSAVLETDDFRGPAIRTYLRLGFVPEYRGSDDQARWSLVLRGLTR